MTWYVRIPRLNGRNSLFDLYSWLERSGMEEVDYDAGGWCDNRIYNIAPHLKFEREEDATAYVLARGGKCSKEIPEMIPGVDYFPGS